MKDVDETAEDIDDSPLPEGEVLAASILEAYDLGMSRELLEQAFGPTVREVIARNRPPTPIQIEIPGGPKFTA